MTDAQHGVVKETEEQVLFKCGHTSWARFSHLIFGVKRELQPEYFEKKEKCGDCMLKFATDGITQCARCKTPIFKGDDCIRYTYGLCCLSSNCGTGPMGAMPGIWNGVSFVDGITAGTVKMLIVSTSPVRRK